MLRLQSKYLLIALLLIGISISAIAWQKNGNNKKANDHQIQDTIPSKHHNKIISDDSDNEDIDEQIRKLDKALEKLDGKIENIDWKNIQQQIDVSIDKMNRELTDNEVDVNEIQKNIQRSIDKIDFDKITEDATKSVQQAEKNIDFNKIQKEVQHSLDQASNYLNSDEFKKQIEEATKVSMKDVRKELEKAKIEIEKNKIDIKEEIDKAKDEIKEERDALKDYKRMLNEMENAGLVNSREDYEVEYKDGDFFINHRKQPQEVLDKYKKYFHDDYIRIYKKNGRFNISID